MTLEEFVAHYHQYLLSPPSDDFRSRDALAARLREIFQVDLAAAVEATDWDELKRMALAEAAAAEIRRAAC